ncbi:unnamed protein product [Dovyalis caffra]|uniref:DFDF domain-containing protein n=1 Tax=Dovyalis caffra TaxID=77055 RepID=A0AAV1QNI0_9ROSI|nr:unnamed protein product [Dovyalis caffra]
MICAMFKGGERRLLSSLLSSTSLSTPKTPFTPIQPIKDSKFNNYIANGASGFMGIRAYSLLSLNDLRDNVPRKQKIRKGRGIGSGKGKTAGRVHKGQKARGTMKFGFEGGQTPMRRRLPKRGFKNPFSLTFQPVGLGKIAKLINAGKIDSHELITMKTLKETGAIGKQIKDGVRLMGRGLEKIQWPIHLEGGTIGILVSSVAGADRIAQAALSCKTDDDCKKYPIVCPATNFMEDFDFAAMNEKFKKDEIWGQLGKSNKCKTKGEGDDNDNDNDNDNDEDSNGLTKVETKPVFGKDNFFDSVSHNSLNHDPWKGMVKFSEQMKLDKETFGDIESNPGGRAQGSRYGRGYCHAGWGRERVRGRGLAIWSRVT